MDKSKQMRVLILGISWPSETFIARLMDGLLRREVSVTVGCRKKPSQEWFNKKNFSWLPFPQAAFFIPFLKKKWDIIYLPWNSTAVENLKIFELGLPVVVSCRGAQVNIAPHNPERKQLVLGLWESFKKAKRIHCVSEDILKEAAAFGLDIRKAAVITPAVDVNFFQPSVQKKTDNLFKIVSTGSLIWRKGYEYALMTIRKLVDAGVPVSYNIIGEGPDRQRILYTIDDLNLSRHVHLAGSTTPEKIRDSLQAADLFLLSSVSEGISNAVLEAMACGLPIVTADAGGMREAVTDGVEGFIVPVRDPEAMASAVLKLVESKDLRLRMGKLGRDKIMNFFSIKDQIINFKKLFSACLNE